MGNKYYIDDLVSEHKDGFFAVIDGGNLVDIYLINAENAERLCDDWSSDNMSAKEVAVKLLNYRYLEKGDNEVKIMRPTSHYPK